jgi:lysine biosynthesis protein LysW
MATCPECDAEIDIDKDDLEEMEVGDPWDCDACASRLRVLSLDPLDFESDDDEEDEVEPKAVENDDAPGGDLDDLEDDDDADDKEDWDE